MVTQTYKIDGNAIAGLDAINLAKEDLSEVFREFGEHRRQRTEDGFRSETDPYGGTWTPLTNAYLKEKQKRGQIQKIMQATGDMRNTHAYEATATEYVEGYGSPLAVFHHILEKPQRSLPHRLLMPDPDKGLPQPDQEEFEYLVEKFFSGTVPDQ